MREEILHSMFGGGSADWEMLDDCRYDFDDIKRNIESNNIEFNDILSGAISLYKEHIQNAIDNKKEKIQDNIEYLNNKIDCCAEDKCDAYELDNAYNDLDRLDELDPYEDIEEFINFLDTHIYIIDDDTRAVYEELLADEIKRENDEIGFVELDLDE